MRGTERPAKVQWTRPFLVPLEPISQDAAVAAFMATTDNFSSQSEVEQVLQLTDNLPLAIDLLANLVDAEGCTPVLHAWETNKTSLLSAGLSPHTSLDVSIKLSLDSPRMTEGAKNLLALLAILPDGLSAALLLKLQSHPAYHKVLEDKT